jgi:hypothetical protein
MVRTGARIASVAAVIALLPAAASARVLHTVLEDDTRALFSPVTLPLFTDQLRWLGIDTLRISAEWKLEAPNANSPAAPRRFVIGDPHAYDSSPGMRLLDDAVRAASAAGLEVILDPAFSAPLWATANHSPNQAGPDTWFNEDINLGELASWETMLARRYSGSYVPAGASAPLPRVQTFTLWNEPNQVPYEAPQWKGAIPASADWYRALVERAYPAIKRAAPGATVLIGDTSATGGSSALGNAGVPPLTFIRRLACVDAQLRPISDGTCASFTGPLPGDGWSQHPYERQTPPWVASGPADPNGAEMGDLGRLQALLDRLVARGRFAPGVANLWLTEQGYESNGQLRDKPWTEAQQAELNAISEYLAWRDPQISSFSQFLLEDTRVGGTLALRMRTGNPNATLAGTWTTGLERENGAPKPALAMFRSPVVARAQSAPRPAVSWLPGSPTGLPAELVEVWGRARPVRSPTLAQVQVNDDGSGSWRDAATAVTDSNGIFDVRVGVAAMPGALVRFRWLQPGAGWETSPVVDPLAFPVP